MVWWNGVQWREDHWCTVKCPAIPCWTWEEFALLPTCHTYPKKKREKREITEWSWASERYWQHTCSWANAEEALEKIPTEIHLFYCSQENFCWISGIKINIKHTAVLPYWLCCLLSFQYSDWTLRKKNYYMAKRFSAVSAHDLSKFKDIFSVKTWTLNVGSHLTFSIEGDVVLCY